MAHGASQLADPAPILAALSVAVIVTGDDDRVRFVNPAAEQLFDMGSALLMNRRLASIFGPGSPDQRWADARDERRWSAHDCWVEVGHRRLLMAAMHVGPFGPPGWRVWSLQPAADGDGHAPGSAAQRLRPAAAAAAMLAHEVKNPLAGIRGAAQLIARQSGGGHQRMTDLICAEVDRIASLIDRMQNLSRTSPPACAPINIYPAIHQARDVVRAAHGKAIRIVDSFDPSLPTAQANHDALVQVVLNLLQNAADAVLGQPDAEIRLAAGFRPGLALGSSGGRPIPVPIQISISDNGPGIDPAIADSLFDAFVTTKRDGHGLGLAVVARLVQDMGGMVQHRRSDGWTRFRLYLPVAPAVPSPEPRP